MNPQHYVLKFRGVFELGDFNILRHRTKCSDVVTLYNKCDHV